MEARLKEGSFYVNLPQKLYEKSVLIANKFDSIDLGLLSYLLHQILKLGNRKETSEKPSKWASLCSKILNELNHKGYKAAEHLDVLASENVVNYKPYYKAKKRKNSKCKRFAINEEYLNSKNDKSKPIEIQKHLVLNKHISKKRQKRKTQRRVEAEYRTKHLTRWLSKGKFSIDEASAIRFVDKVYSKNGDEHKHRVRLLAILEFEENIDRYSREGKGDRLHTYFTSLPSDLKQFISFDKSRLKEADIKSSQPFILTVLLEKLLTVYSEEVRKHGKISFKRFRNKVKRTLLELININKELSNIDIENIANNITIMFTKEPESLDFTEFQHFISLVRNNDIYIYVGEKLLGTGAIWRESGNYYCNFFDKGTTSTYPKDFKNLRSCAKEVTIQTLYSSTKSKGSRAINQFKSLFPSVFKLLDNTKSKDKAILPILMQRIEAKSILDYCTKKIAKKHPKMPLITIHDSVSTTIEYFDTMKSELQILLKNYFAVEIKVGAELW